MGQFFGFLSLCYTTLSLLTCSGIVASIAEATLKGLHVVVRLHVNLQVVTSAEGRLTLRTLEPLVAGVQLNVAITRALVLEESMAELALKRCLGQCGHDFWVSVGKAKREEMQTKKR